MIDEKHPDFIPPSAYVKVRRSWLIVIDKMIALDIIKTLLSVWSVLVIIIVSKKFIKVLEKAIEGQVSNETLAKILGLKTLIASIDFLPAALFMAVLMVLGRMYRDQEMSAIASAGGGSGTIYRAVFIVVVPLTVMAAGLSLFSAPWAENKMEQMISQDEQSADIRGIAQGKFSEYSQGDLVFYVESIDTNKVMHNVFLQQRKHGNLSVINAPSAKVRDLPSGRYLIFQQGERIEGKPGALNFVTEQYQQYGLRIDEKTASARFNRAAIPTSVLGQSSASQDRAELQRRWSTPMGMLLLSFLAVPLAQISPRGGVYGNMLVGFLIYFSYGNLLRTSQAWIAKGSLTPWQSGITLNLLMLIIGLFLLGRLYGWPWLRLQFKLAMSR